MSALAVASVTAELVPVRDYSNVVSGAFATKLLEESIQYRSISTKFHDVLRQSTSEPETTISAAASMANVPAHAAASQHTLEVALTASITDETPQSETAGEPMPAALDEQPAIVSDQMTETASCSPAASVFKVMTSLGFQALVGTESLSTYLASR
jgi:hypothetical protein